MPEGFPMVGVGVLITNRAGEVLVGRRRGSSGAGQYGLPGGRLEYGESFEACAERETLEETGLHLKDIRFAWATSTVLEGGQHVCTIYMQSRLADEEAVPVVMEPGKCDGWQWAPWRQIPCPVFKPLEVLLDSPFELSAAITD